jgi:hypothetical protein
MAMKRFFLGFLHKLVPHESLTLPFEPFRIWLQIRGDIRNKKNDAPTPWEPRFKSGCHNSFWDLVVPDRISLMTLEIYK